MSPYIRESYYYYFGYSNNICFLFFIILCSLLVVTVLPVPTPTTMRIVVAICRNLDHRSSGMCLSGG